jgi:threonyl-tRNA synthetase
MEDDLHAMRHSLAHIMATAVLEIWPKAKLGVGPVVENGFYYDIDIPDVTISEADFKQIERVMRRIISSAQPFELSEMSIDKALQWAENASQPYKIELLNDLKREGTTKADELTVAMMGLPAGISGVTSSRAEVGSVTFYTNGNFTDLCRGPHVASTNKVGAFKLMRIAGAYWRGKDTNPQMQRLYGVAFATEKELNEYLQMLEEAKKRDHRKLGQELDLFVFSELVGSGLPLFTPRGTILRSELERYSQELQSRGGYEKVWIPHITRSELYKVSGHYDKYPERFMVSSIESSDEFMMKPMNCPHHTQIYASKPRSYRDLPMRYMENTTIYRDEKHGELHGLSRVRAISQDDSHAFVRPDQIKAELTSIMEMVRDMYATLGMEWFARLSLRDDSDKYIGDESIWQTAEKALREVVEEQGIECVIGEGEAAFYGPKIDIMIRDALGREWQCATDQLDFVQPERFGLEYTAEDGTKQRPVMIHKALLGSVERFLSVYIEHTAGKFPVWLAPEQIRIATVNQTEPIVACAEELVLQARQLGLRVTFDNEKDSVGKKIRNAEMWKVPYTLVIGEQEAATGRVSPRIRRDLVAAEASRDYSFGEFLQKVAAEEMQRAAASSL